MEKQIVRHFSDNDIYSFSVCYFYLVKFPRAYGRYTFTDRNNTVYPKGFAQKVKEQLKAMESLVISKDETDFMREKCYYFPTWFYTFLKGYRFNSDEVKVSQDEKGHLSISIEGLLWKTVFWEVPILAIVSELKHSCDESSKTYNKKNEYKKSLNKGLELIKKGLFFSEFGTRRRFSFEHQDMVIESFIEAAKNSEKSKGNFSGTSNLHLAMKYGLTPIGTMSHQVISFIGAIFGYKEANFFAMDYWQDAFDSDLGTYLYDTYGWDAFQKNFSKKHAKLFEGLRVDSGDNFAAANKIIAKYQSLNIDPETKILTFSNGLDIAKAIEIHDYCQGRIKSNFGIGTFLSCDITGVEPMNIVIKLTDVRLTEKKKWQKAVKLSDDKGKHTGDPEELEIALKILDIN